MRSLATSLIVVALCADYLCAETGGADKATAPKLQPKRVVFWKVDASAPTTETRCLFEDTDSRFLICGGRGAGWGQEVVVQIQGGLSGKAYGTGWAIGAEHAIAKTFKSWGNDDFGAEIVGDPKFPLTFKVGPDGYYYLCGRGTITVSGKTQRLGYDVTEDDWIEGLSSENQYVREGCAAALGWLKSKKGVPALLKASTDKAWEVRRNVAESLGFIGDRTALPFLEKMTKDPKDKVGRVAGEAMTRIGKTSE